MGLCGGRDEDGKCCRQSSIPIQTYNPMKTSHYLSIALLSLLWQAETSAQTTERRFSHAAMRPSERASVTALGAGRIALGSPAAHNPNGVPTGAVYLIDERTGRALPPLYPPGGAAHDGFGSALAISGTRIAVGAPGTDAGGRINSGAVYVFELTTGRLIQQIGTSLFYENEQAGMAVAMEGDTVVIGAPFADFGGGSASGVAVMWQVGSSSSSGILSHPAGEPNDLLGYAVALQGGLIAVSAAKDRVGAVSAAGSVQLYDAVTLTHLASVSDPMAMAGDNIGGSLALDGTLLVAGSAMAESGRGKVVTWSVNVPGRPYVLARMMGSALGEGFGASVAAQQGLIAVGSPGRFGIGAVRWMNGMLVEVMPQTQPLGLQTGDEFGRSVALYGGNLIAAAPGDDSRIMDAGAAWRVGPVIRSAEGLLAGWRLVTGTPSADVFGATHAKVQQVVGTATAPVVLSGLTGAGRGTVALWSDLAPTRRFGLMEATGNIGTGGIQFTRFLNPLFNENENTLYVRAWRAGPGINGMNAEGLFRASLTDAFLQPVLTNGQALPDGSVVGRLGEARVSNRSEFMMANVGLRRGSGFTAVTPASDSAWVVTRAGTVLAAVREGTVISPLGTPYGQMPVRTSVAADRGFSIFTAQPVAGSGVSAADNVFVAASGVVVARKGSPALDAQGSPVGVFSSFSGVTGDDRGAVFRASMRTGSGVSSHNNEGLWSDRTGSARLVLRQGITAPGFGRGVTVRRILRYGMNLAGHLLVQVQVGGSGITSANDGVLYWNRNDGTAEGQFEVLLHEGQVVPGTGGARIGRLLQVDFTSIPTFSNSHYGVLATLVGALGVVSAADNLVWITGSAAAESTNDVPAVRRPMVTLRKGTRYFTSGSLETLRSFSPGTALTDAVGCLNTGLGHSLGFNFGRTTLKAELGRGRQAVVSADR